jgi:2-iminobutanoate/2-iminopropanoate deaminase
MKNIIVSAGGTLKNVGKVTVYISDFKHRDLINQEWLKMFPDENGPTATFLKPRCPPNIWVQIDVIASL